MSNRTWIPIAGLAALCFVDWAWTVAHLLRGVEEANPVLAWAFESGGLSLFTACKFGLNVPALAVLAWQREHRLVRRIVPVAVLAHGLVLGAHVATEAMLRAH